MGPKREASVSEKKNLGETVLGWFVVREEDEEEDTPEKIIAKYGKKGPLPPPPPPPPDPKAPPSVSLKGDVPVLAAGAAPDPRVFAQVFKTAQIGEEAQ